MSSSNADIAWAGFDPDAYFAEYYGEPHRDDVTAAQRTAAFLRSVAGDAKLDMVDIGTGASLIPLLAALPVARTLTAWEYGAANVAWLKQEVQRESLRPQWQTFWSAVGDGVIAPAATLAASAQIVQGSIFDLPRAHWQGATMFFCAESITGSVDEFARACARFVRCTLPGAPLVAAFLAESRGYAFGDARYPAVPVTADLLVRIFAPLAGAISIERICSEQFSGVNGYTGMLLLSARASG